VISGENPSAKGFMRIVEPSCAAPERVPVDETLTGDGPLSVPDFMAFHTPGHTAERMSFRLERAGGVLFAGTLQWWARAAAPFAAVIEDRRPSQRASARLAELTFEAAVFGHGKSISRDAASRFREFARGSRRRASSVPVISSASPADQRRPITARGAREITAAS
jgi:glyoxylase-like metal-dependent hydrolase (beta-lactamase superfamily II)